MIQRPTIEELSPDLRWKLANRQARLGRLADLGTWAIALTATSFVAIPQLNALADDALASWGNADLSVGQIGEVAIASTPIQQGEEVAGYPITSGYGPRDVTQLPAGASANHRGIDAATPTGTPIHALGETQVKCWQDDGGGGLVADIQPKATPSKQFQALHLADCLNGVHAEGTIIAYTGDSGIGAEHLDWRQRDRLTGNYQHPQRAYLLWALQGRLPVTHISELQIICAVGAAEGTRSAKDCSKTWAWEQHIDPGNGATNQGTFSYQHGAESPEAADAAQLAKLNAFRAELNTQAIRKFGQPLSTAAAIAALDLYTQSELAAGDFLNHLSTPVPSQDEIETARVASYHEPESGKLDAPGLGNDLETVKQDQARRTQATLDALQNGAIPAEIAPAEIDPD